MCTLPANRGGLKWLIIFGLREGTARSSLDYRLRPLRGHNIESSFGKEGLEAGTPRRSTVLRAQRQLRPKEGAFGARLHF
jgi:hypothetical protein